MLKGLCAASQLQLKQLTELESHLATLGATIPHLASTTGYLGALSIAPSPMQVAAPLPAITACLGLARACYCYGLDLPRTACMPGC